MANVESKHKAVWDWLTTCPYIGDLFFNAGRAEDGNTVIIPSEQEIAQYIDGSSLRNYNCALTRFLAYSTDPNDPANIAAVADLDAVAEWVEQQMADGELPDFPDGIVKEVRMLPNESGYIAAQSDTQAKYMIQFQIEYIKL